MCISAITMTGEIFDCALLHFNQFFLSSVIDNVLTETLVANGLASEATDSSGFGLVNF